MKSTKPKKTLGTVKVISKESITEFYIGAASFSIASIGGNRLLNFWADSYHYERHNNKEVLVGDASFEILHPLSKNSTKGEVIKIDFTNNNTEISKGWEETHFSHFYLHSHFKFTNWSILITPKGQTYKVEVKGYIVSDLSDKQTDHFFESIFETKLRTKIDSRWLDKYKSEQH